MSQSASSPSTDANVGASPTETGEEKVELSIRLDADLMRRMNRLTDNPSKVIEAALKQWLTGARTETDSLARPLPPTPPVPPKGEWND